MRSFLILCVLLLGSCHQDDRLNDIMDVDEHTLFIRDVISQVNDEYVDEVDQKKLAEYAMMGLLSNLDRYSTYLTTEDLNLLMESTRGEFGGVGMEVLFQPNELLVITPIENMPAAKAGIQSKDLIIAIAGKPVSEMRPHEAIRALHGKPGTLVTITVKREGVDSFDVKIKRAVIKDDPVKTKLFGDVLYVRLYYFNDHSATEIKRSLQKYQFKSLILDLRNNPGGTLDQAVAVSNLFLDHGKVVRIKSRNIQHARDISVGQQGQKFLKNPMVVLINGGSASGSEVVAGALRDHKRAILLGEKSFGKGSVQQVFPIPGHGAIKLTVAKFFTPKDHAIHEVGLTPDINVRPEKTDEQIIYGELQKDDVLKKAITIVKEIGIA